MRFMHPLFVAGSLGPLAAQTWQPGFGPSGSGGQGFDDGVYALASYDAGSGLELYAGGWFLTAGGTAAAHVARRTSTGWASLGSGIGGPGASVFTMSVFDDGSGPALYVAGTFDAAGGLAVNSIARWNGSSWSDVGGGLLRANGTSGVVYDLLVWDDGGGPALHAAGLFAAAGGVPARNLARWRNNAWTEFGGGYQGIYSGGCCPYKMHVHDDGSGPALFVAGEAATVGGGVALQGVGKWDGTAWSALGSVGLTGGPFDFGAALATYDDGTGPALYVGGDFAQAGGVTVNHIARWNGSAWSALGSGLAGTQFPYGGSALAVFDDGGGPCLYVAGLFETAGGVASEYVARWNGAVWQGLEGGFQGGAFASGGPIHIHADAQGSQLYFGGTLQLAGGMPSEHLAVWSARQPTLRANGGFVSVQGGGSIDYQVRFGASAANQIYGLLGSLDGSDPGTPLPNGTLPLNAPIVTLQLGVLGANGDAIATLTLPANSNPALVGVIADLAAVTVALPLQLTVSNRTQFRLRN
jgi:trimeric autotransporter adhesin